MSRAQDIERFVNNPDQLVDLLSKTVKSISKIQSCAISEDKVIQYNEISKTIDRLKESGAEIPVELRRLKLELMDQAEEHEQRNADCKKTLETLQMIESRLGHVLTEVRASITRLSKKSDSKVKPKKRYTKRTSPTVLTRELKKALRELGGSARKSEVLARIRVNMDGRFKEMDLERDSQGVLNWEKWVVTEKGKMIKQGILKTGTGFGIWELRR